MNGLLYDIGTDIALSDLCDDVSVVPFDGGHLGRISGAATHIWVRLSVRETKTVE